MEQRSQANAGPPADDQGRPAGTLGPHTLGSIISNTFTIYGNNFFKLIVLSLILFGLSAIIAILVIFFAAGQTLGRGGFNLALTVSFIFSMFIMIILVAIARIYIDSMIIVIVAGHIRGQVSVGDAFRAVTSRFWAILGASLLGTLACIGMTVTVIGIPFAIYFGLCWSFIIHVILLEGRGATESLSRTVDLTKKNWWRVLGIMFVMGLIIFAMGMATYFIPVVSVIAGFMIEPLGIVAATLLYFDLRVRKENYTMDRFDTDLDRVLSDQ
ncbi:MAG TPA: hypothetical protein VF399_09040 [bacterium]